MLGAVPLGQNVLIIVDIILEKSEIQAEPIAGKVPVSIECRGSVNGIDIPDTAVVVKIQIQVHSGPPGQAQNRDDIVVALASQNHWDMLRPPRRLNRT